MEVEDDLDVVFHKGVESEGTSRELPSRKRSISGQAEKGSASKKFRLSSENDVIEL